MTDSQSSKGQLSPFVVSVFTISRMVPDNSVVAADRATIYSPGVDPLAGPIQWRVLCTRYVTISLSRLLAAAAVLHDAHTYYTLHRHNCYWFARAIWFLTTGSDFSLPKTVDLGDATGDAAPLLENFGGNGEEDDHDADMQRSSTSNLTESTGKNRVLLHVADLVQKATIDREYLDAMSDRAVGLDKRLADSLAAFRLGLFIDEVQAMLVQSQPEPGPSGRVD